MSMVNTKQLNATVLNASTSGYVDCSMNMSAASTVVCHETRVISPAMSLPLTSSSAARANLIIGSAADFPCVSRLKLKLVLPVYLSMDMFGTVDMSAQASEVFNLGTDFALKASSTITKSVVLRKANPGIVFVKYSLQYLNAGRITINKNKYL